jgi:hypothetical protein
MFNNLNDEVYKRLISSMFQQEIFEKINLKRFDLDKVSLYEAFLELQKKKSILGIPKTKHTYVLFSGGKGSLLAAFLLKIFGYEKVTLYFNDTKSEDEDLYRFLSECVAFLKYPLIEDSDGRNIWEVFKSERFMGNHRADVCSKYLKREVARKFAEKVNKPRTTFAIGIDPWESHRYDRAKKIRKESGIKLEAPLISGGIYDKDKFYELFESISSIKQPRLYDLGFAHNNCGGFCIKAGLGHYKRLLEVDRERYLRFEREEEEVYKTIGSKKPFLQKMIKGKFIYLSLKDYREALESGKYEVTEEDSIISNGCNCALPT